MSGKSIISLLSQYTISKTVKQAGSFFAAISIFNDFLAKLADNKHNPDALNLIMSMPQFEGAIKEVIDVTDTDGSIKKVIRFYDGSQTPPV